MNLLILEPPYSHLFHDLAKELRPSHTYVHLFNLGYLIYLPTFQTSLISKKIKDIKPKSSTIERVKEIRSLANSNIKSPEPNEIKIMAAYMEYLSDFITKHSISHIICHNDLRWQHAIAKEVASEKKISIYFSEEGLFRPHTLTFDPNGVNAFSSVPRDVNFYEKNQFTKVDTFVPLISNQLKRALRLIFFTLFMALNKMGDLLGLNVKIKNKNYSFHEYLKLFISKLNRAASKPSLKNESCNKFIFVPLQVSTDTQTIIHSKFKGTQEVINLIENAYRELPEEIRKTYSLVFKKHPMEAHIDYQFGTDSIVSSEQTGNLINDCSIVVLVNSTTIVEALMKRKRVITLGESHYDIKNITFRSNESSLSQDILTGLKSNDELNQVLINSFLDYLKYHYQINGNIFYYDQSTIEKLKMRIHP